MLYQKWGNIKFAYRNREFWCKGYYSDTVGQNTVAIKEYIANQLKQDKEADQLSVFDPNDPFKGSKQQMHDWQVNKKCTCAPPVMIRANCPKMKYHPLYGWIICIEKTPR